VIQYFDPRMVQYHLETYAYKITVLFLHVSKLKVLLNASVSFVEVNFRRIIPIFIILGTNTALFFEC
jgi:hypothetical protein